MEKDFTPESVADDNRDDPTGDEDRGDNFMVDEEEELEVEQETESETEEEEQAEEEGSTEEDEGGDSAEEEEAVEEVEEEEEPKKPINIPKTRFDQVVQKARRDQETLLEENAKLKAQLGMKALTDDLKDRQEKIEDLSNQYEQAIFAGEQEKARAIRTALEAERKTVSDLFIEQQTTRAKTEAIEEYRYDTMLAKVEATYEELNEDSPNADPDKLLAVSTTMHAFVKSGMSPADALQTAVKYIMGAPKPKEKPTNSTRKEEARKKIVKAVQKQPPSTASVGANSDKKGSQGIVRPRDVIKMTDKEFDKLSPKDLARLRGDYVGE